MWNWGKTGRKFVPLFVLVVSKWFGNVFGENNLNGLESISAKCLEQLGFNIKIFIILYADDTVIMSEPEEGLQQAYWILNNIVIYGNLRLIHKKQNSLFSVNENTKHKDRLKYTTRI